MKVINVSAITLSKPQGVPVLKETLTPQAFLTIFNLENQRSKQRTIFINQSDFSLTKKKCQKYYLFLKEDLEYANRKTCVDGVVLICSLLTFLVHYQDFH